MAFPSLGEEMTESCVASAVQTLITYPSGLETNYYEQGSVSKYERMQGNERTCSL